MLQWALQIGATIVENTVESPQKNKIDLQYNLAIPVLDVYLKKIKTVVQKDTSTYLHTVFNFLFDTLLNIGWQIYFSFFIIETRTLFLHLKSLCHPIFNTHRLLVEQVGCNYALDFPISHLLSLYLHFW